MRSFIARKILLLPALMLAGTIILFTSCSKEPGDGGNSAITGKVLVHHYNYDFTVLLDEYWAADQDVYIIYGDGATDNDRVRAGPEGDFKFSYLRKGNYQIYVYSDDSTMTTASGTIALYRNVEITKNKQTMDAGTIVICKK
jgi:hypothetical protein